MALLDLTIQSIAFRVLALLIIVAIHGAAIAGAAVLLGDKGPRYDGRLTLVPAGHVDMLGGILMVLFGMGWAKPVAVDAGQFRIGRPGIFVVILAGFASLLVTAALLYALILPALTTLPHSAALTTAAFLRVASSLSIWFALFSLVPVPPLAAGMLLGAFGIQVPRTAQLVAVAALAAAVALGLVRPILAPAYGLLSALLLGQ